MERAKDGSNPVQRHTKRHGCAGVIHRLTGVERAKDGLKTYFGRRESESCTAWGAGRAKPTRRQAQKERNRSTLPTRYENPGSRKSETNLAVPNMSAEEAKVRAQRERKALQLFVHLVHSQRFIYDILTAHPCLYPFNPKPKQISTRADPISTDRNLRRRRRRSNGADSALHSEPDSAIPPPFRYARKGASLTLEPAPPVVRKMNG